MGTGAFGRRGANADVQAAIGDGLIRDSMGSAPILSAGCDGPRVLVRNPARRRGRGIARESRWTQAGRVVVGAGRASQAGVAALFRGGDVGAVSAGDGKPVRPKPASGVRTEWVRRDDQRVRNGFARAGCLACAGNVHAGDTARQRWLGTTPLDEGRHDESVCVLVLFGREGVFGTCARLVCFGVFKPDDPLNQLSNGGQLHAGQCSGV